MYENHSREQLLKLIELYQTSQSSLIVKLEKVQRVSRSRLKRMNQRGKLLIEARATLAQMSREAHGG